MRMNQARTDAAARRRLMPGAGGLAAGLRAATAAIHADLERLSGLTRGFTELADYAACLLRHHAAFAALEPPLAEISGWPAAGIDVLAHRRLPQLRADLAALNIDIACIGRPAISAIPATGSFPAGLGALYVLEGSSLGGLVILRDARARLGPSIDGATAFFGGGPDRPSWPSFKSRLDAFGAAHPAAMPEVIAGALAAFAAFAGAFGGTPDLALPGHGLAAPIEEAASRQGREPFGDSQ
jgi:heme oxygenase